MVTAHDPILSSEEHPSFYFLIPQAAVQDSHHTLGAGHWGYINTVGGDHNARPPTMGSAKQPSSDHQVQPLSVKPILQELICSLSLCVMFMLHLNSIQFY